MSHSFNDTLKKLNPTQQLLMCAALCQRMLPNHQLWWQEQHPEEANGLTAILDTVWERLSVSQSRIDFAKQQEKLFLLQPDMVKDDSLGAFLALDACMGIDICLNCAQQADDDALPSLSRLSRASVTRFIDVTDPDFDERYSQHPLMVYEFEIQNWLLNEIAPKRTPGANFMRQFKRDIRELGVSNVGIEY